MSKVIKQKEIYILEMLRALGGKRFFIMTGSKPTYKDLKKENPELGFKLVRNNSKANYMRVRYNTAADLYEIDFLRITTKKNEVVKEFNQLYYNQLQSVFTQVTGLYTRI